MLLQQIKQSLRVTHSALDGEIIDLIQACKIDLKISGVANVDETDPIIVRAITVYCKANFGFDNAESEKFQKSYELLKNHLALCGEYNGTV